MGALFFLVVFISSAQAKTPTWHAAHEAIWDTRAHRFISLADLTAKSGEIFVLGEEHATADNASDPQTYIHHDNQLRLIQHFQSHHEVSVGMEFLDYTVQSSIDDFLQGILGQPGFISQSGWDTGNPFAFYERQILAPAHTRGRTVGLNIPHEVTDQIAQGGPSSLTDAEKALLPPVWEKGNDAYFARFQEAMDGHVDESTLENYFWAQSLWDDTMAWKALAAAEGVLVVIVGEFHVEYGGGLPYELKKLGSHRVRTMVQMVTPNWKAKTLQKAIQDDPKYGALADFIWLHEGAVEN